MLSARQLRDRMEQGENIAAHLRQDAQSVTNTQAIIELAYDLQAGSYVAGLQDSSLRLHKERLAEHLAGKIRNICQPASVLDAGMGEATTLSAVMARLASPQTTFFGFDISWSRIATARAWLRSQSGADVVMCTGELQALPYADSSVDVVYTTHAIEPNRGAEEAILRELHRVARECVVLFEPDYDLASADARERMDRHGYCRGLRATAEKLGYEVVEHTAYADSFRRDNPSATTVIRKRGGGGGGAPGIRHGLPET
jgi:SAM-dependent methyltransferase